MNISQYVENLRHELLVAAEAGGDEARALAERLTAPLESATRLVLLEVLSDAAAEITSELAPGSVDVRLRGRDPELVVTPPPIEPSYETAAQAQPSAPVVESEEGSTTRTTLRLPEQLKGRVEEAANHEGLSVNTWLVRAISAALEPTKRSSNIIGGNRLSGWVN